MNFKWFGLPSISCLLARDRLWLWAVVRVSHVLLTPVNFGQLWLQEHAPTYPKGARWEGSQGAAGRLQGVFFLPFLGQDLQSILCWPFTWIPALMNILLTVFRTKDTLSSLIHLQCCVLSSAQKAKTIFSIESGDLAGWCLGRQGGTCPGRRVKNNCLLIFF